MKTFIASICTFSLLLLLIVWNCFFIGHTTERLSSDLKALPVCYEAAAALDALERYWSKHHTVISFSISFIEINNLDACIAQMKAAVSEKDALQFETARLQALDAVRNMQRLERISWDLIL